MSGGNCVLLPIRCWELELMMLLLPPPPPPPLNGVLTRGVALMVEATAGNPMT